MSNLKLWVIAIVIYIGLFLVEIYAGVRLWNECLIDFVNVRQVTPIEFAGLMVLGRILGGTLYGFKTKSRGEESC